MNSNSNVPDFYLASTEGYGLENPRRAWRVRRLRSDSRDDLLLIEVEPPIRRDAGETGPYDLSAVIVATRHQDDCLFPIKKWPVYVHVAEPLFPHPEAREVVHSHEFRSIAWAELYRTEHDAREKLI